MASGVVKQTEHLVNPFGPKFVPAEPLDLSSQLRVYRVETVEIDKETLIVSPVFTEVDIQEEIQKCKNLCGVEYMKQQLARGLAKPEDFMARPEDFHDVSSIPQDVHTASRIADMTNDELAKLAKIIGIKETEELTAELFEERLKSYIEANWKQPEQSVGEVK